MCTRARVCVSRCVCPHPPRRRLQSLVGTPTLIIIPRFSAGGVPLCTSTAKTYQPGTDIGTRMLFSVAQLGTLPLTYTVVPPPQHPPQHTRTAAAEQGRELVTGTVMGQGREMEEAAEASRAARTETAETLGAPTSATTILATGMCAMHNVCSCCMQCVRACLRACVLAKVIASLLRIWVPDDLRMLCGEQERKCGRSGNSFFPSLLIANIHPHSCARRVLGAQNRTRGVCGVHGT